MIPIESIWSMAHLVPIPRTAHFYANPTIDLRSFNTFFPRNEPEDDLDVDQANGDADITDSESEEEPLFPSSDEGPSSQESEYHL
jgi:hypothetical protein